MSTRTISNPWDGIERRSADRPFLGADRRASAVLSRAKAQTIDSWATTIFLGMLMLFVATLSVAVISKESIRLDEAQSLWQTTPTPARIVSLIAEDVHVPLYHLLLHYWRVVTGEGIGVARLFSLLFFLGSLPAMYHLGRVAYGRTIGMFGAFLFAISPFLNWYGSEARMYSMLVFFTVLNQYFFLKILQKPGRSSWIGYAATAVLGTYTHYFFGFVLIAQALFYFLRRPLFATDALKKFIITALVLAFAMAPWLLYVHHLGNASNTRPMLERPTTVNLFNTFSEFIFGFQSDHLNTIIVSMWPVAVLLGFFALRRNRSVSPETLYFIFAMTVPILGAFVLSFVIRPFFVARYLILALPSLYLFLGWLFSTYPQRFAFALKTILLASMLFTLGIQTMSTDTPVKEEYRQATEYLNKNVSHEDVVIVSAPFTIYPIEYSYTGTASLRTLPIWNRYQTGPIPAFDENSLPKEVDQLAGRHQKAYVVLSYDQGYEDNVRLYFDSHYERLSAERFTEDLNVYVYKLRYDDSATALATPADLTSTVTP